MNINIRIIIIIIIICTFIILSFTASIIIGLAARRARRGGAAVRARRPPGRPIRPGPFLLFCFGGEIHKRHRRQSQSHDIHATDARPDLGRRHTWGPTDPPRPSGPRVKRPEI